MESGNYADASINKILQKVSAVVNWGVNNGLVNYDYTKGLKLKGAKSQRRAFTDTELNNLVVAFPTDNNLTLAQQWALRVGMITGARIGEILQLTQNDIKQVDGLLYIDINKENGKTVKNESSIRCVPLTDGAMGFSLDKFKQWIERQPSGPIFKESATAHVELNAFIKRHTVDTGEVSFHSLRHYMATIARAKGVTEADIGGILGHASTDITFGVYGSAVSIHRSAEVLQKVLS
ncbi:tyrosine-type recombinase/integrase [Atlantibacter subterranea]|nr:tyrosine-type recombinase/integrase [Atlantibacter subterranea]